MTKNHVGTLHVSLLTLLAATVSFSCDCSAGSIRPVRLRCEYQDSPVGVDAAQPRLDWMVQPVDPAARDLRQTAYRILVATREELLRDDQGDMWDSGRVAADTSLGIRYDGQPLRAHARYYWQVRLWDQDGVPCEFSAPANFTTGLHDPDAWMARWITAEEQQQQPSTAMPIFRRQFQLTQPVRQAVVFICGLGHYELRLNGQRVGNREMDPGWTNYRQTCFYSGYDVTEDLRAGDNTIGVMLGNGMYNVTGGRYVKFTGTFGPPKLICQLHVTLSDGTTTTIASDQSWRCTQGPITFSCIYGGEDYDARREQSGWDTHEFDDSTWKNAVVCDGPGGRLRAQFAPPILLKQRLQPVSITPSGRRQVRNGLWLEPVGTTLSKSPRPTR